MTQAAFNERADCERGHEFTCAPVVGERVRLQTRPSSTVLGIGFVWGAVVCGTRTTGTSTPEKKFCLRNNQFPGLYLSFHQMNHLKSSTDLQKTTCWALHFQPTPKIFFFFTSCHSECVSGIRRALKIREPRTTQRREQTALWERCLKLVRTTTSLCDVIEGCSRHRTCTFRKLQPVN